MITRNVVCEEGTLSFDIREHGVCAVLKQRGKLTPLKISQSGNVDVDEWVNAYVSGLRLGAIKDDYLHIKLNNSGKAYFNVHKCDFEGIVLVDYSMTGTIVTSKFLECDYKNIRSSVDLCTSVYDLERKRWNLNIEFFDDRNKAAAENESESNVVFA